MLDYKFRAWHKASKEMVYFDMNKVKNDQYQAGYMASLMAGDYGDVLMLYTGLNVSSGGLWEGDNFVVKSFPNKIYTVVFINGSFSYRCLYGTYLSVSVLVEQGMLDEILVIGNVYEGLK